MLIEYSRKFSRLKLLKIPLKSPYNSQISSSTTLFLHKRGGDFVLFRKSMWELITMRVHIFCFYVDIMSTLMTESLLKCQSIKVEVSYFNI